VLLEDPEKSYHAAQRVTDNDLFDNRLIFGDNLLALKALEQDFAGKVKCVFIDPPYNTGSAFTHYDDGLEHSIWLGLMRDRLEAIRQLMSDDGSLWVTIDDNEAHYLKVLCDEVFGRANFVSNVVWQKKSSAQPNAVWLSDSHDHVLVFAKNKQTWRPNRLPRSEKHNSIYKHSDEFDGINPDGSLYGRGPWFPGDVTASLRGGQRGAQFARTGVSANIYPIIAPSGREILPPAGTCWRYSKEKFAELCAEKRITFGKDGNNRPCLKRFLSDMEEVGIVPMTVWHYDEVGENRIAANEAKAFNESDPFPTPKPEALLGRILTLATQAGDLVLDSFAGSGTTGAVAHKMGRRWIMVELGNHCHTHIIPRLKKVIDGEDPGGITEAVDWKGGGGFRYYRLAPSLLEKDKWGNWVISKEFNAAMLAEACCKLEGFQYAPSDSVYWQHGHSTERDFMYVTTQQLNGEQLAQLSDEVGSERTLLVLCPAFRPPRGGADRHPNLTVKKIPKAVLARCEWGHDDYSLKVENLPEAPPPPPKVNKRGQQSLFSKEARVNESSC
jgi:adenine-specific DNA-methyltransferase